MSGHFVPCVGGVSSADLAVPEQERELQFYSRVLTTGKSPLWREDLMDNQGTPIIGLGARSPEYDQLPLQWMPHIQVAEASAAPDFFSQVVGWSAEDVEMGDESERYADFSLTGNDGSTVAGVCHALGVNQGLQPVWMIYLPVGDLAESVRRVGEEGGKMIKGTIGSTDPR